MAGASRNPGRTSWRAGRYRRTVRDGALGVEKNDLVLIERSRKVSHFSLQETHPESSSERVLTARRYRNFGRQRFGSMGKVWACGQKRNKWRRRSSSASSPRPACRVMCIYESGLQRHFEGHRLGRDAARLAARLLADQQRQKISSPAAR